jgi:hypothetical protein
VQRDTGLAGGPDRVEVERRADPGVEAIRADQAVERDAFRRRAASSETRPPARGVESLEALERNTRPDVHTGLGCRLQKGMIEFRSLDGPRADIGGKRDPPRAAARTAEHPSLEAARSLEFDPIRKPELAEMLDGAGVRTLAARLGPRERAPIHQHHALAGTGEQKRGDRARGPATHDERVRIRHRPDPG